MLKWAEWMHALNARPADPRVVGDAWRDLWLTRLRETPPYIEAWMAHPTYDGFWKQGSVIEDYSAIEAAVLAVGGWTDAYTNAVPRLLEHLTCPRWGIIGPWGHVVPSRGVPGPAIGFLQECVRFFDHWLSGAENGIDDEPLLRTYLVDTLPPAGFHAELPGRWVAERSWPPTSVAPETLALSGDGRLVEREAVAGAHNELSILGDQTCGITAGVWCVNGMVDELPIDQREDDALSLCFDTAPLPEAVDLLGRPEVRLVVSADRPRALVSARLCAVAPDGASTLVTWGVLNLAHRDSREAPTALATGLRAIGRNGLSRSGSPEMALRDPVSAWAGTQAGPRPPWRPSSGSAWLAATPCPDDRRPPTARWCPHRSWRSKRSTRDISPAVTVPTLRFGTRAP